MDLIKKIKKLTATANAAFVLTGAGMSADSLSNGKICQHLGE